jgi:hypothetical protein
LANSHDEANEVPLRAGLVAGSVAAVLASLANLPLEAPTDSLFNAGSVTIAALLTGLATGLLWRTLRATRTYAIVVAIAFAATASAAFAIDGQVDRAVSYIVPLAALVFATTGVLTPLASRRLASFPAWAVAVLLFVALSFGAALANQGDAESGSLTLPPRSGTLELIL